MLQSMFRLSDRLSKWLAGSGLDLRVCALHLRPAFQPLSWSEVDYRSCLPKPAAGVTFRTMGNDSPTDDSDHNNIQY